jgi:hypothetical protein
LVLDLKLQVAIYLNLDSVLEVFQAANVPIQFDTLKDFTFEDLANRSLLHKNKCILMGVMVP